MELRFQDTIDIIILINRLQIDFYKLTSICCILSGIL